MDRTAIDLQQLQQDQSQDPDLYGGGPGRPNAPLLLTVTLLHHPEQSWVPVCPLARLVCTVVNSARAVPVVEVEMEMELTWEEGP